MSDGARADHGGTDRRVVVRGVLAGDHDEWAELYRGYRVFYELEPSDEVVERVWGWISDATHETRALVAVDDEGKLVGLAHYRSFARPSSGTTGIYLDDLFTLPLRRGAGFGRALITAVATVADAEGASVVRWITDESNRTARSLYDSMATATPWVTYDIRL